MKRHSNNIPPELVTDIKNYFINNRIEMTDLAKRSQDLFGQKLSVETLRALSEKDPDGSWFLQRQKIHQATKASNLDFQSQVEMVRNVVFDTLMSSETPANAIASLTKAWMDLSRVTENGRSGSAKTSPERALEIALKAKQELENLKSKQPATSESE